MSNKNLVNLTKKLLSFKSKEYKRKYHMLASLCETKIKSDDMLMSEFKCLVKSLNTSNGKFPEEKSNIIIRVSDVECISNNLLELVNPKYLWVDYTRFSVFNQREYFNFLNKIKKKFKQYELILVSPELYNIDFKVFAYEISENLNKETNIHVCTKFPEIYKDKINV